MRKVLFIVNGQREIPPFLITQVNFAKAYFDEIIYVTAELYNDNSETILGPTVRIIQVSNKKRFWPMLKLPWLLLKAEARKDICQAIKSNRFNKSFFRHLLANIILGETMYIALKKMLRNYAASQIIMLAAWFDSNAYAIAKIKQRNPEIAGASLAHAFEVNPERSELIDLSFNEFKHHYLDRISFISRNVLSAYLSVVSIPTPLICNNINIYYLGCVNDTALREYRFDPSCPLELLTCSTAIEIKRLDLIFKALENWRGPKIQWTHIGDGPLYNGFKKKALALTNSNEYVAISFVGKKTNDEVHQYYLQNTVDLFLNVSASEGVPVSIMEALSYGIPVIATNVGGTSEIVNDKTGFLLSKEPSPENIQDALKRYLALSNSEKESYRKSTRRFWELHFNTKNNARVFFEDLISL